MSCRPALSLLILVLWLASAMVSSAQWRKPRLYHLGPEQGMSSWTFDITQDSTGYMYFGTDQGLVRYDGNHFELFAHLPDDSLSIGPGDVRCLQASSNGKIWLGVRLGGFNAFDPKTLKFKRYHYPLLTTNGYETVQSICEDEKYVWIGGDSWWLHRFDKSTEQFESYGPEWLRNNKENTPCSISEILQDRFDSNRLWLALVYRHPAYQSPAATRLVSFDKSSKQFVEFPCYGKPRYQDSIGRIWLSAHGINRFDPESNACTHFNYQIELNKRIVKPLVRDLEYLQNKFLVSSPWAIATFKPDAPSEPMLIGNELGIVEEIFRDAGRNLWFGRTNGISVLSAREEQIQFYSIAKYGFSGRIYPGRLAYDSRRKIIYVGDHGYDGTGKKVIAIALDADSSSLILDHDVPFNGLVVDPSGNLLMSSKGTLYTIDPDTKQKRIARDHLNCAPSIPNFWNLSLSPRGWIGGVSRDSFMWFKPGGPCQFLQHPKHLNISGREFPSIFQGLFFNANDEAFLFSNQIFVVDLKTGQLTALNFEKGIHPYPNIDMNSV
ncbi:MAG TPA: hypothetical protein VFX48_02525, partial [Saprospiraceae bacterium]|nr:hypothetical protein [Saprospiraceae bacterium]